VIWTGGSAWKSDNGKATAGLVAAQLLPSGLAVAGVSIRSSKQTTFPGQLYDIKAAIRWLRANAESYNLDPDHIGIMGDSSGGWTTAIAAVTEDRPELEGKVGTLGVSSAVQAAVAFFPPTDFLAVDTYTASPVSRLLGCAVQTCPKKARAANPARYVTGKEPPIMILHGELDRRVPYNQGELLYETLKKACDEAVFISLPKAEHGPSNVFLTSDAIREGATIRSTSAAGCKVRNATPFTPTWATVIDFLNSHLRG
jgi:acetyl esterase/lipase